MRIAATQPDVANTTMIKRARVAKRRDGRTTAASLVARRLKVRGRRLGLQSLISVGIALIDVGPAQQIVESTDPVPSVTVAFQDYAVFPGLVSPTVVLGKKINQQLALCPVDTWIHENFSRLFVKVV